MKISFPERVLDDFGLYAEGLMRSRFALGALCLCFGSLMANILLQDRNAKTIEKLDLFFDFNRPCSLKDSEKLEAVRAHALRIFIGRPTIFSHVDFTLVGLVASDPMSLASIRTRFGSALTHNEFRCPGNNSPLGYSAGTFVDAEFDAMGHLLRPGVTAFFPDVLSGDSSTQSDCGLVGLLAHETFHSIIPPENETPIKVHDVQKNDEPYKLGNVFEQICLRGV